jgi:hypothetical protein
MPVQLFTAVERARRQYFQIVQEILKMVRLRVANP